MPTPTRLALRLDILSRDELLELAAGALDELPKDHDLRSHADALVAKRKPLPAWWFAPSVALAGLRSALCRAR